MIRHTVMILAICACAPSMAQDSVFAAQSGNARYALAADESLFLGALDPTSQTVFAAALGEDTGQFGNYWADLIAGAVQLRRESADTAETLWFNPLFDVGLAARWQRGSDGWRATAASPISGEALRGEVTDVAPVNWGTSGSLKAAVEAKARATWAASANGGWMDRNMSDSGSAALMRAFMARVSLGSMYGSPGYEYAEPVVQKALVSGAASDLSPAAHRALQLTGMQARLTLRAVAAYRRPDGWTLALQSPDAPRRAWLVHFTDPESGGRAAIKGYQLVDMGAGQ
jgi:hypothetical protein